MILTGWAAVFSVSAQPAIDASIDRLRNCLDRADSRCAAAALADLPPRTVERCADCLELEARAFLLLGRKQEALDAIARAIQLDARQYRFLMTQGRIYQKFEDQPSAIRSFLMADRLQPRSAETFYWLGMSFFLSKEYERAQRHFRHVVELDPQNDKAEFMLGILDEFNLRAPEARAHLEKALSAQPQNPFYHLHYGILLSRFDGDLPAGLREIEIAAKLDPAYALTHYNLGRIYKQMEQYDHARTELETAVKLRPNLGEAWYQLGAVYRQLGMAEQSRKAYETFQREKAQENAGAADPIESTLIESKPR